MDTIGQTRCNKVFTAGIITLLFLSMLACVFFPGSAPLPIQENLAVSTNTLPSTAVPTLTSIPPTETPTLEPPTPTVEVEEPVVFTETPSVQSVPLPAAAPRFKPGDPVKLDLITMKSRAEGWGVSGGNVLTTKDNGLTWREVTPPEAFAPGSEVRAYGTFLDTLTAWVIFSTERQINPNASVWHTTDGGIMWTPGPALNHQAFGDNVWAEFTVLDSQNIWMMIRGVYVGAGTHYNHQLFHSPDGGLTWNPLDSQISDDYTGMVFADQLMGLRTLQTTGAYIAGPPVYEITYNGGVSWETRELPAPPGAPDLFNQYPYCETYQPVVLSGNHIHFLVGCFEYKVPPKQYKGFFYTSQDGGKTWTTAPLPAKVRAENSYLQYFGAIYVLLLGRETYLSTTDGMTWSYVKSVNWDGQFTFSDPQYGWAIASSTNETALVRTVNGAVTWKIIKPVIASR